MTTASKSTFSASAVLVNRSSSTLEITASLQRAFNVFSACRDIGEDRPFGKGVHEAVQLRLGALEAEFTPDLPHNPAQYATVLHVGWGGLHLRFRVRVEGQDFGPGPVYSAGLQYLADRCGNTSLPINQGPIAVEADPFKPAEIKHFFHLQVSNTSLTAVSRLLGARARGLTCCTSFVNLGNPRGRLARCTLTLNLVDEGDPTQTPSIPAFAGSRHEYSGGLTWVAPALMATSSQA